MSRLPETSQRDIDRVRREHPDWGAWRTAKELGFNVQQVRWYLQQQEKQAVESPDPFRVYVWDIETAGLSTDIGFLMMASFLDLHTGVMVTERMASHEQEPTWTLDEAELDVLLRVRKILEGAVVLIGHNSVSFDKCYVNGVSAKHGLPPVGKKIHLDTYLAARYGFKGRLQSNKLSNLADFFGLGVKDHPPKADWRSAHGRDEDALARLQVRCESDVRLTALVWDRMRPHYLDWRGK